MLQVLGLPQNADAGKVDVAYRKLKKEAEKAGQKERLQQLEAAHNSIFMSSLSSRLQVRICCAAALCV